MFTFPTKRCPQAVIEWVLLYTGQVEENDGIEVKDLSLNMGAQNQRNIICTHLD